MPCCDIRWQSCDTNGVLAILFKIVLFLPSHPLDVPECLCVIRRTLASYSQVNVIHKYMHISISITKEKIVSLPWRN